MGIEFNPGISTSSISAGSTPVTQDTKINQKGSIWGDRNNNGVIDREDFDNEADFKMFEVKGFLGYTWDTAKDFVRNLTNGGTGELTEKAAKDQISYTKKLQEKHGDACKVNDDGSVEVYNEKTGYSNKHVWRGSTYTQEGVYTKTGNKFFQVINFEDNTNIEENTNPNGLKQVIARDFSDGSITFVENYKTNENGEYELVDDFMLTKNNDGQILTGSDLAKLFAQNDSETIKTQLKNSNLDLERFDLYRDGGSKRTVLGDGTILSYEYMGSKFRITIPATDVEKCYNTAGELIE